MEWKYVKPIISLDAISEFEKMYNYRFSNDYKECVSKYNGGRPSKDTFDTPTTKEREFKTLLSFNRNDRETIWSVNQRDDTNFQKKYVVFACDSSGNLICFSKENSSIVFYDHEIGFVEKLANGFSEFINSLYSLE